MSEAKRSGANQWFTNTLLSRLDDKRTGAIVVVMQRVHIDDLTGFLLGQSDEWEVLSFPAIAYSTRKFRLRAQHFYRRKAGQALSPEREPLPFLEALNCQIGSEPFSAQYQQSPAPPGGAMIKRHWIRRYSELPPASERLFTLQSWDTATKGGPDNDWSVCTTWIVSRKKRGGISSTSGGDASIIHPQSKSAEHRHMEGQPRFGRGHRRRNVACSGDARPGLRHHRGKAGRRQGSRMAVASGKFEAGQALLPERATWLLTSKPNYSSSGQPT